MMPICAILVWSYFWSRSGHHFSEGARTPDTDEHRNLEAVVRKLIKEAGIQDGDEFEIHVKATGRRPFGNRRFVQKPGGGMERELEEVAS